MCEHLVLNQSKTQKESLCPTKFRNLGPTYSFIILGIGIEI